MSALCAQRNFARCGERSKREFIDSRGGHRESKGIPPSADGGQPARLDRAGPQARTRFRLRAGVYGALGFVKNLFQTLQSHSGHELAVHADVRRRAACALAADRLIHPLSA